MDDRKALASSRRTVPAAHRITLVNTSLLSSPRHGIALQNIVYTLTDYGVPEDNILGIRYGLRGFYERDAKPITLTRKYVDGIHLKGGTMLVRAGRERRAGALRVHVWEKVCGRDGDKTSRVMYEGLDLDAGTGRLAAAPASSPSDRRVLLHGHLQGTSRGGANVKEIVRRIDLWGLNMVFVVGAARAWFAG